MDNQSIVGAVATVIVGLLYAFRDYLTAWLKAKTPEVKSPERTSEESFMAGFRQLREMHDCFETILHAGADRVILFIGSDSGGLPRVDSEFYVRGIHGANKLRDFDPLEVMYGFKSRIDRQYIDLLMEAERVGWTIAKPEEMDDSKLKSLLIAEGAKYCVMYWIGIVGTSLLFVSVARYGDERFTVEQVSSINVQVDRIRSIYPLR